MFTRIAAAALLAVSAPAAGAFLVGSRSSEAVLRDRLRAALERATGLQVAIAGPVSFGWLPRPGVRASGVSLRGPGGALAIDADEASATLDAFDLLGGEDRVVRVTLESPTAAVDLDRASIGPGGESAGLLMALRGHDLRVHNGVVRLRSARNDLDVLLGDLAATWSWPEHGGASLSGEATLRGRHGSFVLALDRPDAWLAGATTPGMLRVKSTDLALDLDGTLGKQADARATGRLSASTRDLPHLLAAVGTPLTALNRINEARLTGSVTLTARALALADVSLGLDGMLFDGALAFGAGPNGPSVAGTMATDRIDLEPFLANLPPVLAPDGRWSRDPLDTRTLAFTDIDMRVSATHARWGWFELEDSALSLQSGSGRMELSLGEGRAYDGLFKGRVVAAVEGAETALRAEASFAQVDLNALADDVGAAGIAAGTTNGHLTLDARGVSPQALVAGLSGRGQVTIRDGSVGPNLLSGVEDPGSGGAEDPAASVLRGPVPFDSVSLGFDLADGTLRLRQGELASADLQVALGGTASLLHHDVDLTAAIDPRRDAAAPRAATLGLVGTWPSFRLAYRPAPPGGAAPWRIR